MHSMSAMPDLTIRDRNGSLCFVSFWVILFLIRSSNCFLRDDFWPYDVLSELTFPMSFFDFT